MLLRLTPALVRLVFATSLLLPQLTRAESRVAVSVVHSADWSPESGREGAGEFLVLLAGAKLQKASPRAGLIVVGDQNGMLRSGGERALRRLALSGVVVVRIASAGVSATTPEMLFVDAGRMSEAGATARLQLALDAAGAPPHAADPDHPALADVAAVQAHLKQVQSLFEAGRVVAATTSPVKVR